MFRMQDQTHVHDVGKHGIGLFAIEHVKKIFRIGQIGARWDWIVAVANMLPHGHNGSHTGDDFYGHVVDIV